MAKEPQFAIGIDAGSYRTRCVITVLEDDYVRFAGAGEAESAGWTRGRITDSAALSASVLRAVESAERNARVLVDAAVIGLGGPSIQSGTRRRLYELGRPRAIEMEDMAFAMRLASEVTLENDRALLQVLPQDFAVDGRAGIRNPLGRVASRLEANTHVITVSAQEHDTLMGAVQRAHINVEETMSESVAAAYASVLERDRSRGVMVIDIGAQSTDVVVFDGEAAVMSASIPISGEHFTRDIATIFKVSMTDAELLKREHGCARLGLTADNTLIEIPSSEGRAPREATRRELNEILEARAEELFQKVREKLEAAGIANTLAEGALLCGGGSLLNGMEDMAEVILDCPARKAIPLGIEHWPDEMSRADWTTAAGLALYSAKLKTRMEFKRRAPGLIGMILK
ncbi:cell division protein FtsA [Bryobacterales bacterium F-183]|nr:cell division protein FtsA [Bryobacterales bacterium F-183]